MDLPPEHAATAWAATLIETLIRAGVTRFIISPGSRSTPLAAAAARHPAARCLVAPDERGGGFYAAGYGAATRSPAALICTSGTAVANYLPAVVESSLAATPMLVLSADRPPELRDTGANQTITQPGIFGPYVRWQFDLPCPGPETPLVLAAHAAAHAVARARHSPSGPVHLNCMFREPLAPAAATGASLQAAQAVHAPVYAAGEAVLSPEQIDELCARLASARRGILAVGPLTDAAERDAVSSLARALAWPVFADIASGVRSTLLPTLVPYYDLALRENDTLRRAAPDVLLHIGGRMTSTRFLSCARGAAQYVHVAAGPQRHDPAGLATLRIEASPAPLCRTLAGRVTPSADRDLAELLAGASARAEAIFTTFLGDDLSEPACARHIAAHLADGHALFIARSMPIRDMDMFAPPSAALRHVGVNAGASGIDGTIATALGYSDGLAAPVTLLIGDVAFLHDLNSLALVARHPRPVTIVLLNNRGGGIFSFLPLATCAELVDPYFAAAHDLTFGRAAELFGIDYAAPRDLGDFARAYATALAGARHTVLEIAGDRARNHALHARIYEALGEHDQ